MAVATGLAIAGAVASAAGTAGSFMQAAQQRRMQNQAQQEAMKAMADARERLKLNYMDALAVQKEPYELEREANLVQGNEAIQAAKEQERGVGAVAGKVVMAQNEAEAQTRTAMSKEMADIALKKATEASRLNDMNVSLSLGEVEGAQQAAADAQRAATAATTAGFQGVQDLGQSAIKNLVPLYTKGDAKGLTASQTTDTNTNTNTKKKTASVENPFDIFLHPTQNLFA